MRDTLPNHGEVRESHSTYRPDIDGLRAIAVLSVIIFHLRSTWLPGGFVGVDVFFVISGFVVTASLAGSKGKGISEFIGDFYARRLARILPALVTVLLASAIAATAFIPPAWLSHFSNITALYAFFGLSNWVMQSNSDTYFAPRAEFNPYTHTWSLGVEEQFYLVVPLLLFAWVHAMRVDNARVARFVVSGLATITIASFVASIWASKSNPTAAFYFIGYRFWELSIGGLAFMAFFKGIASGPRFSMTPFVQNATGWLGLLIIGLGMVYARATDFPFPWVLLPIVGALLIIGTGYVTPTDPVRRMLASPLMVWIGKRSYSLYLWHWPVFVLMRWTVGLESPIFFAAAVFFTFVLAIISYRWIEQPIRHNFWIEKQPNWFRIVILLSLPILGFLFVTHLFSQQSRYSLSKVTRDPVDWFAPQGRLPYADVPNRQCEVTAEWSTVANGSQLRFSPQQCNHKLTRRKMFVFGDSHALHIAGMLEQLSAETGMEINIYAGPGCGFLALDAPMASKLSSACLDFHRNVSRLIIDGSSSGDFLLLSTLRMSRYGDHWASFGIHDMYSWMYGVEKVTQRNAAIEDAKEWLKPFSDKEFEIVFVAPTPIFKAPGYRCADWFNQMNPICIGDNKQARSELNRLRIPIISQIRILAFDIPNIHLWDPFPVLCPGEICFTEKEGRPLFSDGDHLSAYGNLLLSPEFSKYFDYEFFGDRQAVPKR